MCTSMHFFKSVPNPFPLSGLPRPEKYSKAILKNHLLKY